jgi:hypothetical protein
MLLLSRSAGRFRGACSPDGLRCGPCGSSTSNVPLHGSGRTLPIPCDFSICSIRWPWVSRVDHLVPVLCVSRPQGYRIATLYIIDAAAEADCRRHAQENAEPVSIFG